MAELSCKDRLSTIDPELLSGFKKCSSLSEWSGSWKLIKWNPDADFILKELGLKKFKRLYVKKHIVRLLTSYSEQDNTMSFVQLVGQNYEHKLDVICEDNFFDYIDPLSGTKAENSYASFNKDAYCLITIAKGDFGVFYASRGLLDNGNFCIKYQLQSQNGKVTTAIENFCPHDVIL